MRACSRKASVSPASASSTTGTETDPPQCGMASAAASLSPGFDEQSRPVRASAALVSPIRPSIRAAASTVVALVLVKLLNQFVLAGELITVAGVGDERLKDTR